MSGGGPHRRRNGKRHGGGHHGGAWKVAYADFVTAMMAFFLLLWLLNAVSQEQLEGISDYFAPINKHTTTSGGGGLLAGNVVAAKGVFNSRDPSAAHRRARPLTDDGPGPDVDADEDDAEEPGDAAPPARPAARPRPTVSDRAQFAEVENAIRKGLESNPELKALAKSLIIEETPEGLRIQIVDQDGLPMFPSGEAVSTSTPARSSNSWSMPSERCRSISRSPATPTPSRSPTFPATATGSCRPTGPTPPAGPWSRWASPTPASTRSSAGRRRCRCFRTRRRRRATGACRLRFCAEPE